jgi:hypothetical protein
MFDADPKQPGAEPSETNVEARDVERGQRDYAVGRGRPPLHSRYQPGQSGNPSGRPRRRRNLKTEIKDALSKKVKIRDGEKEQEVSLVTANIIAHGYKGAKGDARSAALFLNHTLPLVEQEDLPDSSIRDALRGRESSSASAILFENLDPDRLSRDDQKELSGLADVIDRSGLHALTTSDFERLKGILDKGQNVTSH